VRILVRSIRGRKKAPNWKAIAEEAKRAMRTTVCERVMGYAERIVANWEHKPGFQCRTSLRPEGFVLYVFPTGPNKKYWIWTSRGTPPHSIDPVNAAVLAFSASYTPKTQARGPSYGGSGKSSGPMVFASHVDHPGTTPRHFEEAWARWAKKPFRREMENAMRRGARKA